MANLSFVCACLVVLSHVPWPEGGGWMRLAAPVVRNVLTVVAVQYFFVAAGYLLAAHVGEPGWWRAAVAKRMKSLLVPYVLWMAIASVLMWILSGERPIGLGNCGLDLRQPPLVVPLWFVRGLFLFVAGSPLLLLALDRLGRWLLAAEFLAAGFVASLVVWGVWAEDGGLGGLFVYGLPVEGLFYFSVGLWLRLHPVPCRRGKVSWACLFVALAIMAVCLVGREWLMPRLALCQVAVPFLLVFLWGVMPAAEWPRGLVRCAFPIYVMHAVVLGALWSVPGLKQRCPFWCAVGAGILIPMAASRLLSRFFPRVAGLLFGGRVQ